MSTLNNQNDKSETLEERIERETRHFIKKVNEQNFRPQDAFAAILERVIKETEKSSVIPFRNALTQISELDFEKDSKENNENNELSELNGFYNAKKIAQDAIKPDIKTKLKIN